jgi:hypothetical protein
LRHKERRKKSISEAICEPRASPTLRKCCVTRDFEDFNLLHLEMRRAMINMLPKKKVPLSRFALQSSETQMSQRFGSLSGQERIAVSCSLVFKANRCAGILWGFFEYVSDNALDYQNALHLFNSSIENEKCYRTHI